MHRDGGRCCPGWGWGPSPLLPSTCASKPNEDFHMQPYGRMELKGEARVRAWLRGHRQIWRCLWQPLMELVPLTGPGDP